MVEVVKYQSGIWHMQINSKLCQLHLKPIALFVENSLLPEPPDCNNGLRWRINRKWVSYLQIRKAIIHFRRDHQKSHHTLLLCLHQGTSAQQQIILKMNNDLQPIAERQAGIEAIPMLPAVLSTGGIQRLICQSETLKFNLPCENVKYLFSDWEIDVLSLNKSDYLTEFEVKVSRSDFKADSKKRKWQFYERKVETMISNYFYYACPNGLISVNEIPVFAGLLYVTNDGIETIKKAPLLHKAKHDRNKVLTKFCRIMSERSYLGCCRLTFENSKRRGS